MSGLPNPLQSQQNDLYQQVENLYQHGDEQKLLDRFHQSIGRPPQASEGHELGIEYLNHMMTFAKENKTFKKIMDEQMNHDYVQEQFGGLTIVL